MWKQTMIALMVFCLLLPTACAPQEQQLTWSKIGEDQLGGDYLGNPNIIIATSQKDTFVLRELVDDRHLERMQECDFSKCVVVAIFHGDKGIFGYRLEVDAVKRKDDTITIYAQFLNPDPNEPIRNAHASPYYVLKIEKTPDLHGEFEFILVADGQEIMSRTRTIP